MSADNSPDAEKHNEALFEGYQQRLDQQQQQQNPSQRRSRSAATRPSLSKRMEQLASTPTRRRESNNNNINETPRRSSTPRPSLSFWAGPPRRTVGGRHTLSVEEDSLVLGQHRASMLSATRYRNAQRSSSASQRMGWSDYRDAEEQRHRRMTGGERLAMDIMANNDYQRQEVYARAQEYELEREAYVVDMQISRAERNKEVVEGVFAARQQHRAEAQRFRIGREEDNRIRRREVEAIRSERVEAIAARTSEVKADPYAMLLVRRTYSNLAREERERSATPSRCSSVIRHSRGWR